MRKVLFVLVALIVSLGLSAPALAGEGVTDCSIEERSARGYCPGDSGHEEERCSVVDCNTEVPEDDPGEPPVAEEPVEEDTEVVIEDTEPPVVDEPVERQELAHTGVFESVLLGILAAVLIAAGVVAIVWGGKQ